MNREILFRGKCYDDGEWIFGSLLDDDIIVTKGAVEVDDDYINIVDEWSSVLPETIGQYTGLKDKYNKEIYEGDICWDDEEENYGEVRFLDGGFSYIWQNICVDLFEIDDSIEIVGNIHDNPELLVTE